VAEVCVLLPTHLPLALRVPDLSDHERSVIWCNLSTAVLRDALALSRVMVHFSGRPYRYVIAQLQP
jgi:hypothetical protein